VYVEYSSGADVNQSTTVTQPTTDYFTTMTPTTAHNLTTTHEVTMTTTSVENGTTPTDNVTTSVPGNVTSAFTGTAATGTLEPTTGEQAFVILFCCNYKGYLEREPLPLNPWHIFWNIFRISGNMVWRRCIAHC